MDTINLLTPVPTALTRVGVADTDPGPEVPPPLREPQPGEPITPIFPEPVLPEPITPDPLPAQPQPLQPDAGC